MNRYLQVATTLALLLLGHQSLAQMVEEVIVTGVRASDTELPGVVYKRTADFLLLEIRVINDSRNEDTRKTEIIKTLKSAISLVKKKADIQLSIVKDGFVLPLNTVDSTFDITSGQRPDTSEVTIRVKTGITDASENPAELLNRLNTFADSVPVEGRTELVPYGKAELSVVNPSQYRPDIIELVAADVKKTTSAMGAEYRVLMSGLDAPVQWVRSGPISLAMYIPYSYEIIPDNINAYFSTGEY